MSSTPTATSEVGATAAVANEPTPTPELTPVYAAPVKPTASAGPETYALGAALAFTIAGLLGLAMSLRKRVRAVLSE